MTRYVLVRGVRCATGTEVIDHFSPPPSLLAPDLWEADASTIRAVVAAAAFESPHSARAAIRCTAALFSWAHEMGLSTDPEALFTPDRVDAYVGSKSSLTVRSRGTYRSMLRRVGRAATVRAPWPPLAEDLGPGAAASTPYTADEVHRFWQAVDAQATKRRRRTMRTILALGLGAGVRTSELVEVTAADISLHEGAGVLCLTLTDRVTPIRAEYADVVDDLCARNPTGPLIGAPTSARDRLHRYAKGTEIPMDVPPLKVRRLRSTWAVAVLSSGITISEFNRIAGGVSARTLDMLTQHVPCRTKHGEYLRLAAGR
ncbi:hypothetical protein [Flexivirga caeni]|uniref:hypothetical protein n=1 Tax=Flexivirga caeni TaxID=2294115 RepID=UPI0013156CFC|nr:hypothetical protein [Flexivirga caeni]